MTSFGELGVEDATREALETMGYAQPTPVQARSLPPLLAGRDVFVQAPTGTGKTAAYGIPAVERWRRDGVRSLVLVPTRELATQVAEELNAIGADGPFRAVAVIGGTGWATQMRGLSGAPAAIVATPGRILEHVARGNVDLADYGFVVLDEADRLLDMGFLDEVREVLGHTPGSRQSALLSATLGGAVEDLVAESLRNPVRVNAGGGEAAPRLNHNRINVASQEMKVPTLVALIRQEDPERMLVFTRTRAQAKKLRDLLRGAGFTTDGLHGDMDQSERNHFMDLFRKGQSKILVATDVAARGLDVPEITHVVNYDLPDEVDMAIHRAGRAGRFGREGEVFWFVLPDQKDARLEIEDAFESPMVPYRLHDVPRLRDVMPDKGKRRGGKDRGRGRR